MAFVAPLFAPIAGLFTGASAGVGGALSGIAGIASAGLGVASAVASAAGAKAQASYQAKVAENNAKIAENNAANASETAQMQQLQQDQQTAAVVGSQLAEGGASGLSVGTGSMLRTRRSTAQLGRQDALNIRAQGQSNVMGYLQDAENYRGEASSARAQGRGAVLGGVLNAASSLVGAATSVKSPNRITGAATRKSNYVGGGFAGTYRGGNY